MPSTTETARSDFRACFRVLQIWHVPSESLRLQPMVLPAWGPMNVTMCEDDLPSRVVQYVVIPRVILPHMVLYTTTSTTRIRTGAQVNRSTHTGLPASAASPDWDPMPVPRTIFFSSFGIYSS